MQPISNEQIKCQQQVFMMAGPSGVPTYYNNCNKKISKLDAVICLTCQNKFYCSARCHDISAKTHSKECKYSFDIKNASSLSGLKTEAYGLFNEHNLLNILHQFYHPEWQDPANKISGEAIMQAPATLDPASFLKFFGEY